MDSCMIAADATAGSDVGDFYGVGIDIDFVAKNLTASGLLRGEICCNTLF